MKGSSRLTVHSWQPFEGLRAGRRRGWRQNALKLSLRTFVMGFLLLTLAYPALGDPRGQVSLGLQFDGWSANTVEPFKGSETFVPFSFSYGVDPSWWLSGQTSFASGSYTDSIAGTETQNLSNLTASTLTSDYYFNAFGVSNMAEVSLTLPTGDPSWETKQVASNIPAIFINSRYQDEGWGASVLYALSFSAPSSVEYGVSAGYSYSGAYDPYYGGVPGNQLKMGDSIFVALNRIESLPQSQSRVFRLCVMAFLPSQINGQTNFELGPNGSASYSFNDPSGFSWSVGTQVYTLSDRYYLNSQGSMVYGAEPFGSSGQRFYFTPALALGNLTLAGNLQFVRANGYPISDYSGLYNGGGVVVGLAPSYAWNLDAVSALTFSGGYNFIAAQNASTNFTQDVDYQYWTFGASYAVKIY